MWSAPGLASFSDSLDFVMIIFSECPIVKVIRLDSDQWLFKHVCSKLKSDHC